jgi:thiamine biosynthesis lipoprotein
MGTVVSIQIVGHGETDSRRRERAEAVARAAAWFAEIEKSCSRFDPASELRKLSACAGTPVPVSATLYEAVKFAVAVAKTTGGMFDPTVGARMEQLGFDRRWETGEVSASDIAVDDGVSWRDVLLDADAHTITLCKPLVLDLGAVAKGLAVDTAARELIPFENYAIDAGGDLYLAGHNAEGKLWSVGIRHPRADDVFETMLVSNNAVCTSGDYERKGARPGAHHILDGRNGGSAAELASVTVIAPMAMAADTLATAAFALGRREGIRFLEHCGVRGVMITPSLERIETAAVTA